MPTVAVDKADLWERIGQEYSAYYTLSSRVLELIVERLKATEQFDKLCFDYGLELDEDVGHIRAALKTWKLTWNRRQRKLRKLSRLDCLRNGQYVCDVQQIQTRMLIN